MFDTSLNVLFNKKSMRVCHQISLADSDILCSKNQNIKQHFFPFMFETTTTFMTRVHNQTRKNGVILQERNTRIDTSFGLFKV